MANELTLSVLTFVPPSDKNVHLKVCPRLPKLIVQVPNAPGLMTLRGSICNGTSEESEQIIYEERGEMREI